MYRNIHWEYCNILQYTNFPNTQPYSSLKQQTLLSDCQFNKVEWGSDGGKEGGGGDRVAAPYRSHFFCLAIGRYDVGFHRPGQGPGSTTKPISHLSCSKRRENALTHLATHAHFNYHMPGITCYILHLLFTTSLPILSVLSLFFR